MIMPAGGTANAAVFKDEVSEGVWVCEEEDSYTDGLAFRDGHAINAQYADMFDLDKAEDDDEENPEEEGFKVTIDEEALHKMYQWVDDELIESCEDSVAVVNTTEVLSKESVETEVDELTAIVVLEDTEAAIERDEGVSVAHVELYDSHLACYCCLEGPCMEPQVEGCPIKGVESKANWTNVVCEVQAVSLSLEIVGKLPCQVVDASYVVLPLSSAKERARLACCECAADIPLCLVYVMPSYRSYPRDDEELRSQCMVPSSEQTYCIDPYCNPLHLHHYRHCRHASLLRGRSPNIRAHA